MLLPVTLFSQTPVPEEYDRDEFPRWALDLRRFESIFIGALPFTFIISGLGVDYYNFLSHGQDSAYAPWPVSSTGPVLSDSEQLQKAYSVIFVGISLSAIIAIADMIIFKSKEKNRR